MTARALALVLVLFCKGGKTPSQVATFIFQYLFIRLHVYTLPAFANVKVSDPLPFQFWYRHASKCDKATFVDVDYPQLMEKKRDRMLTDALLRDALLKTNLRSSAAPIHLRSDKYMALGCDLKDPDTLERVLRAEFDLASASILFVAEVSITYMPILDSNALIKWATKFDDGMY